MTSVIDMRSRQSRLPRDTFALRVAMVRHEMDWNFREAAAAVGVSHQSWQNWESGKPCSTMEQTCERLAAATGFRYEWLMVGGALDNGGPNDPTDTRRNNPCYSDSTVILGPWSTAIPQAAAA